MNDVLSTFLKAYAERDNKVDFSVWLADELQQELPGISTDESKKLSDKIISSVATYDKTLADINKASTTGLSGDEWLTEHITESYTDIPFDEIGNTLQTIENNFYIANARLMENKDISMNPVEHTADYWNEYSILDKSLNIGKQAIMSGLGVAAAVIKQNIENGETINVGNALGEALQSGMDKAKHEVKATVAGAIKVAVDKGLKNVLPEDTPIEFMCDMAGVAVEGAEALFDVATGKATLPDALEKIGKATIASAGRLCSGALKAKLIMIPYVGPLVANIASGLLEHLESPKFVDNVYTVVHDLAKATWEGIKESGKKIMNNIMNLANQRLLDA
jgi:hypothetical protein